MPRYRLYLLNEHLDLSASSLLATYPASYTAELIRRMMLAAYSVHGDVTPNVLIDKHGRLPSDLEGNVPLWFRWHDKTPEEDPLSKLCKHINNVRKPDRMSFIRAMFLDGYSQFTSPIDVVAKTVQVSRPAPKVVPSHNAKITHQISTSLKESAAQTEGLKTPKIALKSLMGGLIK